MQEAEVIRIYENANVRNMGTLGIENTYGLQLAAVRLTAVQGTQL
jgi:hypothetical protein